MLKPSTLAHFELGILLANDVELALTLHNLAILASLLDGCLYFHDFKQSKVICTGKRYGPSSDRRASSPLSLYLREGS